MSDVTFVRGYGFPRGGAMDYAGYAGAGCGCGGGCGSCSAPRLRGFGRAVRMPEQSLFETIPALDGYNETEGSVDVNFGPLEMTMTEQNEMVLPTLDPQTGKWYDDQGREIDPRTGRPAGGGGLFMLLGLGLVGAALFLK